MRRVCVLLGSLTVLVASSGAQSSAPPAADRQMPDLIRSGLHMKAASQVSLQQQPDNIAPNRALITQYCVPCHNERARVGGLMLDKMDLAQIPAGAETWEKVVRKLRGGMMPPQGMPRPDQATLDGFASWLDAALGREALAHPNPGRASLHRLN